MDGFGPGYETTGFSEQVAGGERRRLRAYVFWRGRSLGDETFPSIRARASAVAYAPQWTGSRWSRPLRLVLFAPFLPIALAADWIRARRRRHRLRGAINPAPMTAAVRAAKESARYEAGTLTIANQVLVVPEHTTLVVFVEPDAFQESGLAITTRRIATEPYTPKPPISDADRELIRAAKAPDARRQIMQKGARKMFEHHLRGEGQIMMAIHRDPACAAFMHRALGLLPE